MRTRDDESAMNLDSGFYIQHPYYLGMNYNMSRILGPGATAVEHDENGHGSAEAGNILAIAPDVTFIGVKSGPNLTAAFKETVRQSPDIISVSLGFDLRGSDNLPQPSLAGFLRALEAEIADAVTCGHAPSRLLHHAPARARLRDRPGWLGR